MSFAIPYLLFFLLCGFIMARFLLPHLRPLLRGYIGVSLGLLLMMWLPVLLAYQMAFTLEAHLWAAGIMAALTLLSGLFRDRRPAAKWNETEEKLLTTLLWLVIPMTVLSAYLQYTHSIRPAANGGYHVGQSTYGDLSLHLAVTTSIVNAKFPLHNSLMLGATMAYPYLSNSFATTMYMLGFSLPAAMAFTGTLMMALVYTGYTLLAAQLCRRRGAAALAVCLLFFNGGLGFFYTLSGRVEGGNAITFADNLKTVMEGFYKTPTNQPDPNNLRWVNIICDMLIPQRGILGGWTMLMPCFNLLIPPLCRREKHGARALILLGLFAGGMPLLHTHSFLALAIASAGMFMYSMWESWRRPELTVRNDELIMQNAGWGKQREKRGVRNVEYWRKQLAPWLLYIGVTAALALPQLFNFTFVQATDSEHFLRFQFNWCNNRGGRGLVDPYFWFYIKNIGPPFLLIFLALMQRNRERSTVVGDAALGVPLEILPLSAGWAGESCEAITDKANEAEKPGETGDVSEAKVDKDREVDQTDEATQVLDAVVTKNREAEKTGEDCRRQNWMIACGAFLIFLIAELIIFQPNEYDNNKLFYVWFLLCLPMAADYAFLLYERIKGVGGRRVIAALFLVVCFLSAGLTVARECVSDYRAYSREDIETAEFVKHHTPEHSVFVTGSQHLNPVSSLAGRTILCSADIYLFFHGFNTSQRRAEIAAFYADPAGNLDFLEQYVKDIRDVVGYQIPIASIFPAV